MLFLILGLLVVGLSVAVFLWIGSVWLQGYVYSEPAAGLGWRAAATGGAVMLFLAVWCFLNYRAADATTQELPFDTVWSFSPAETYPREPWNSFGAVKKDAGGKEVTVEYRRRPVGQRGYHYVDKDNHAWDWNANGVTQAVIIKEAGQDVRFNLELPPGGKLKEGEQARYVEDDGQNRTLTADQIAAGQVTRVRHGLLFAYVLLNLLHLGLWFVCFWLLLRFQWPHALGLAVVFWVVVTLAVLPPLFSQTKAAARNRPAQPTAGRVHRDAHEVLMVSPVSRFPGGPPGLQ